MVNSLALHGRHHPGYDGPPVPINQRYFKGGDSFRGFALAGIGPRDLDAPLNTGAIGGNVYAIGTLSARLPSLLPESYGVSIAAFTDFGTLGRVDNVIRACTPGILRQRQFRLPGLGRPQLRLEIALRPGADRSGPAYRQDQVMTGRRSSTSPLEQDSKTMKKTLLALIVRWPPPAAPALAANSAAAMPQRILLIDRQAILRFSKVGQDVAKQVQGYGNQAKADIAGQQKALQAEAQQLAAAGGDPGGRRQGQEGPGLRSQAGRHAGGGPEEASRRSRAAS